MNTELPPSIPNPKQSTFVCAHCGTSKVRDIKQRASPPRGWVKMPNGYWCDKCKKSTLVGKPASLKVVGVLELQDKDGKTDWKAFKERLKPAFLLSTGLANMCIEWLRSNDIIRTPTGYYHAGQSYVTEKMPKMPGSTDLALLRDFIRHNFVGLDSSTWDAISRRVMSAYVDTRFDTVWRRSDSPNRYKPSYPLPFPSTRVNLSKNEKGNFVLRVCLLTGEAYHLILSKEHHYQNSNLERVLTGEASVRETLLMLKPRKNGDSKTAIVERSPETRNKQVKEVWVKIVILRPVEMNTKKDGEVEMYVHTDKDSLLVAHKSESMVWRVNADNLQRRITNHYYRLHRLMDDRKAQRNNPRSKWITTKINDVCRRHREYVEGTLKCICGELATYAASRRITVVKYDDSVKDFLPKFPWRNMRDYLENSLRSRGIGLDLLTVEPEESEDVEDVEVTTEHGDMVNA